MLPLPAVAMASQQPQQWPRRSPCLALGPPSSLRLPQPPWPSLPELSVSLPCFLSLSLGSRHCPPTYCPAHLCSPWPSPHEPSASPSCSILSFYSCQIHANTLLAHDCRDQNLNTTAGLLQDSALLLTSLDVASNPIACQSIHKQHDSSGLMLGACCDTSTIPSVNLSA